MGPILFNLYIIAIFKIIDKYKKIKYHSNADDLQLYIESSSANDPATIKLITNASMTLLYGLIILKINHGKTKVKYINVTKNRMKMIPNILQ